jgi:hypothetical protein
LARKEFSGANGLNVMTTWLAIAAGLFAVVAHGQAASRLYDDFTIVVHQGPHTPAG